MEETKIARHYTYHGKEIRVIEEGSSTWFVANDIARAVFGLVSFGTRVLYGHVSKNNTDYKVIRHKTGNKRDCVVNTLVINESGIFELNEHCKNKLSKEKLNSIILALKDGTGGPLTFADSEDSKEEQTSSYPPYPPKEGRNSLIHAYIYNSLYDELNRLASATDQRKSDIINKMLFYYLYSQPFKKILQKYDEYLASLK